MYSLLLHAFISKHFLANKQKREILIALQKFLTNVNCADLFSSLDQRCNKYHMKDEWPDVVNAKCVTRTRFLHVKNGSERYLRKGQSVLRAGFSF